MSTQKWAVCGAILACMTAAGCAERDAVGPRLDPASFRATQNSGGAGNSFFIAWSGSYFSTPIQTQKNATDSRQYRQYTGFTADANVLAFAAANPGKLYINGDEPDQTCVAPYDYAGTYHDYVAAIRGADPTARVSPAGFAEPNPYCCPTPPGSCYTTMHSTSYAGQFYSAYVQRYGVAPPVNEWRFHDFGLDQGGNVSGWWTRVSSEAAWSVAHGANMVLGSWGFLNWSEPLSTFQDHMKQAMALVLNDARINQAVWWSYENTGEAHYLENADGTLTGEGQTYSNIIPADIPSGPTLVGSAGGHAKLQWSNTTTDWGIEGEFWVQPGGSGTYFRHHSDKVAPGAIQTTVDAFTIGDRVKGRARYYNRIGSGPWSAYSNTVLMH